jgi:ABC-type uncharacterized transport system permease subunit
LLSGLLTLLFVLMTTLRWLGVLKYAPIGSEETRGARNLAIVQKLSFLLGGLVAPISLYPDWLFGFAKATPFGAHLYWVGLQALTPSVRMFWIGVGWQIL